MLTPTKRARSPATFANGGTSLVTIELPAVNADSPIAHELVDARHRADHREVLDDAVPAEPAHAREHAVVADPAVVGDVEAVLDQVVVAERGDAAVIGQPDVDRDVLADLVVLADHELAGAAVEAEHLRRQRRSPRTGRCACARRSACGP